MGLNWKVAQSSVTETDDTNRINNSKIVSDLEDRKIENFVSYSQDDRNGFWQDEQMPEFTKEYYILSIWT